jgi:flagellar operon protein
MAIQTTNIAATGLPLDVLRLQSQGANKNAGSDFSGLFKTKINAIKFSAHATSRMSSRRIAMTPELMGKLEKAVTGAANKGARESLVLLKNCAFIVNIPNRTVVTAMDGESLKENIFTNIDSAVLAD